MGVGFTTQGFDVSLPYIRQPGSFDSRAAWIFEGVGADEPIGGFGLVMEGACGFETDRADHRHLRPHGFWAASARVCDAVRLTNSERCASLRARG